MTKEEAIKILQGAIKKPNTKDGYLGQALDMAIQALSQISDIKAIINNPMYIQEDVLRYQMICEVVKE